MFRPNTTLKSVWCGCICICTSRWICFEISDLPESAASPVRLCEIISQKLVPSLKMILILVTCQNVCGRSFPLKL